MPRLNVNIRIEHDALWATVVEYPGVFATGDTVDELRESLAEGIALVLAEPGHATPTVTLGPLRTTGEAGAQADLAVAGPQS